jgi:hypothetical protein
MSALIHRINIFDGVYMTAHGEIAMKTKTWSCGDATRVVPDDVCRRAYRIGQITWGGLYEYMAAWCYYQAFGRT